MSSTQMQEPIGTTTLNQRDILRSPSAKSSPARIDTTTNPTSGSHSTSGKKTTRVHTSHVHESSPLKNVGQSITNIPLRPLRNQSSQPSSPLSPRQPPTHFGFPHSNSSKPVPVLQPHHSVSDVTVDRTYACRPLQHLFRPYSKPTPHPHLYPRLRLHNPYYAVKSTFDTSTNPTFRRLHKLTFRHCHNKLCHHITSVNIPR